MGLLQLKSYLKNFLNVEEESILKSWSHDDPSSDCCHWERVECSDVIGGHVLHLSLDRLLPASYEFQTRSLNLSLFHSFPRLQSLNLSSNSFSDLFDPINGRKSFQRLEKLRTLDFYDNGLNNSFFTFLSAARSLTTLNFGLNFLDGVFPPNELENMTELRVLNLQGNGFSFFSAQGLINLRDLEVLDLSSNSINDSETGYGLRRTNLKTLDLRDNELSEASQLKVLKDMPMLQELDLRGNEFTDLDSLGVVLPSSLHVLNLANNTLSSTPKGYLEICALMNLRELDLRYNALTNLPYCLGNLSHLRTLDLSGNQLNGSLSSFVSGLPSALEYLSLLDNNFKGSFWFSSLVNHSRLTVFKLSSEDMIHGTIPSSLGEMKSLKFLDMSCNRLYGQLPETFLSGCYSLGVLKLSNNRFHGKVFPRYANLTGLGWLFLDGNGFDGSLEKGLFNSKFLTLLDIADNKFSGTLPSWIGEISGLTHLYLKGNKLKGPLPDQLQNLQLEVVDISDNSFSGSIPGNLNFSTLGELRLHSNEFTGSVPSNLFKANVLEVLDLRHNNLSGMILDTTGKASSLRVLLLRNNSFRSHIPENICQLSKVGLLDLSHNKFKGAIPPCFGNMYFGIQPSSFSPYYYVAKFPFLQSWSYTSALYFDADVELENGYQSTPTTLVDFLSKNRYEAYQNKFIGRMYGLDLSSNQLSGEIPVEVGDLKNIVSLNFSRNRLIGSIPDSISNLKNLESLDLSNNKLDGNIPPQLADLNNLGYFDVSYNNLSGEIPFKSHLVTFDEKSYRGNAHLCGLPTNVSCNPERVSEPEQFKEEEEESDDMIDMVWFYWTCGAVYISTCLAVFAFLYIDSRWSREWFHRVDSFIHRLQSSKGRFVCN